MRLDIYGTPEDPLYLTRCRGIASSLPSHIRVHFLGIVRAEDVVETLRGYDALLMPTAGENFGHVIAEALSAACIVVTTPHTPWTALLQGGGGVVVRDRSVDAWRDSIAALAELSVAERLRGRIAAAAAYDEWCATPKGDHIWSLAERTLSMRGSGSAAPAERDGRTAGNA